jgi:hypothetical protein
MGGYELWLTSEPVAGFLLQTRTAFSEREIPKFRIGGVAERRRFRGCADADAM